MTTIGVFGLEPFVVGQVERVRPDANIVEVDGWEVPTIVASNLDVVVVSEGHARARRLISATTPPPLVVIEEPSSPLDPGHLHDGHDQADTGGVHIIRLSRPVSTPQLQQAIDRSLGTSSWRRMLRTLTMEQDESATAERVAAVLRTVAALAALGVAVAQIEVYGLAAVIALALFTLVRTLWWRLTPRLLAADIVLVTGLIMASGESEAVVLLVAVVWAEAGFLFGAMAAAGLLAATAVIGWLWWEFVFGVQPWDLDAAVSLLALVAVAVAAGAMAGRLERDVTTSRRSQLQRFRSSLYDLSRRQAVVAVSFDTGTVAQDMLARLLSDVHPRAAVVLVADGPGPLLVAASHGLSSPPPTRMLWTGDESVQRRDPGPSSDGRALADAVLAAHLATILDGDTAGEVSGGASPGRPDRKGTPDRNSTSDRFAGVIDRLRRLLPDGEVICQEAQLEGEILGGLLVVGPSSDNVRERLRSQADEAALALDSVRLFNRLRSFTLDQERSRIGHAIHDGVMQTLAHVAIELDRASIAAAMQTSAAEVGVTDGAGSRDASSDGASANDGQGTNGVGQAATLLQLRELVLTTVEELRTVVNDLRTVRLDRGLSAAMEAMASTLTPAGGPEVTVSSEDVGFLPAEVQEQLLRITQEAVANAVRHARATLVDVRLTDTDDAVVIQIRDDGQGFTSSRVGATDGGVGLTSMRQRATAIGAGIDIDSVGIGTIVTVFYARTDGR